jgi:hypothetical protein
MENSEKPFKRYQKYIIRMEFRKRTLSSIVIDDDSIIDIESEYVEKERNNINGIEEIQGKMTYIKTFINLILQCLNCKYRSQ